MKPYRGFFIGRVYTDRRLGLIVLAPLFFVPIFPEPVLSPPSRTLTQSLTQLA